MRQLFLLVACVIGSAVFTSGQTPARPNPVIPTAVQSKTASTRRVERTGQIDTVTFRGSVRMVLDNVTITADEVDARMILNGAAEYDLRGNVHVTINPR
jgi:lipopolysaccharide assembly outer membrane protein LptD (OstA)